MKAHQTQFGFSKSLLALAVIAACVPAFADDEEAKQLSTPQSSVSAGAASASGTTKDRSIWGQYNGMRQDGTTLILDLDIIKRNDADGTGLYLKGRNLGLDSRDLNFSYEKQGDWKVGLDYSELTHHEIRTVNTALQGAGTTTPNVVRLATPGTGSDLDMSLKRVGAGLSVEKWISNQWQFEASFKNEDKTGSRLTGRGYACAAYVCTSANSSTNQSWALLMLPEPVNSAIKQIDAKFNFHDQKLTVSAGYYGSFYTNNNGSYAATVPGQLNSPTGNLNTLAPAVAASVIAGGGTSLQNVLQLPTALPPDNQAHQLYVSGGYRFTPSTNSTFKYAYTHATQNKDFVASGLTGAPAGVTNLGGEVNNTLVQAGLTSKVAPKLSLLGNVKWEDKDDKTPDQLYNVEGGTNPTPPPTNVNRYWNNYHASTTRFTAKGEAAYQLPAGYRATLGLDYTSLDRPVPIQITDEELAGLGAVRSKLQETGYRLEMRRSIDETLTGALSYGKSRRTGGDWTSLNTSALFASNGLGYGQTGSAGQFLKLSPTNAFPMTMVDIDRQKVKLWTNWTPSERAAVNFTVENSTDTNATDFDATYGQKGWSGASNLLINIDASYAVTDNWNINGFAAQGNQNQKINHSTGYQLDLKTVTNSVGFGLNGKASSRLELGATFAYLFDESKYGLGASTTISGTYPNFTPTAPAPANVAQVAIGLPNVSYEQTVVGLYGKYSLDKSAAIHMNLTQFNAKLKEWSWSNNGVPFTYSDNTTVGINPDQSVTYVGVAYVYKFY